MVAFVTAEVDLVVIGAGPAGMTAAATAAEHGLSVMLLDEQREPGGQIYRGIETVRDRRPADLAFLGPAYAHGATLADALRRARVDARFGATVWHIADPPKPPRGKRLVDPRRTVVFSREGDAAKLSARAVLVATGAMERPVPIPGWTLPGVMTVGAAQSVMKAAGIAPEGRLVLAGSGPLLLQFAAQCVAAEVPIAAIVDTAPGGALARAVWRLPAALPGWRTLLKGAALMRSLARSGVPVHRGAHDLVVEGEGRVERLSFSAGGGRHSLDADVVCLHEGVVPNTQMTRLVGAEHRWVPVQRCFAPTSDDWGETTAPGVYVAGDGGGILGAGAAERSGRITALAIAHRLGAIPEATRDLMAAPERDARFADAAVRPLLDAMYPPPDWLADMDDDAIVCRCEEVTAGALRQIAGLGCPGPNQAKAFLRAGMGPCQGRMCGLTVTEVMAKTLGRSPAEVGYYRIRPPTKPVTVGELAAIAEPAP